MSRRMDGQIHPLAGRFKQRRLALPLLIGKPKTKDVLLLATWLSNVCSYRDGFRARPSRLMARIATTPAPTSCLPMLGPSAALVTVGVRVCDLVRRFFSQLHCAGCGACRPSRERLSRRMICEQQRQTSHCSKDEGAWWGWEWGQHSFYSTHQINLQNTGQWTSLWLYRSLCWAGVQCMWYHVKFGEQQCVLAQWGQFT